MRQTCTKKRSSRPDWYFCKMVREQEFYDLEDFEDEDEYEDEENEEYEDELTRATERAGWRLNDDGEFEYEDEFKR